MGGKVGEGFVVDGVSRQAVGGGLAGIRCVLGSAPEGTDDAEEDAGDDEGDDDVECLGGEEGPEEGAVLTGDDVLEAGFQPDADEGEAEEEGTEGFGHAGFNEFALGVGGEGSVHLADAEDEGSGYEADDEFREFLPDDVEGGGCAGFLPAGGEVEGDEEGDYADEDVLRAFDDDGMLVGEVADDGTGGGDAAGGVNGAPYPCTGDFLDGGWVVEEEGEDEPREPGHEVYHGHDNDEDEGDDVGEFAVIAPGYAGCGDAGGDAADGEPAGEYHGGALVNAHAAGYPVGEEPDDADDEDGLEEPHGAGFHDIAEEDGGAEADDAYLDEVFALDGGLEPRGDVEEVADEQPEEDGEEDGLEAVVGDGGYAGSDLRQQGDGEYGDEGEGYAFEGLAQEEPSGGEGGEHEGVEEHGVLPVAGCDEAFGYFGEPAGYEGGKEEEDGADGSHYPVLSTELFYPSVHVCVVLCCVLKMYLKSGREVNTFYGEILACKCVILDE